MSRVYAPGTQQRMCHDKRRYLAEIEARIAAGKYVALYGVTQRPYRCPNCSFWHLTTSELKGPSRASANPVPPSMAGNR